MTKAILFWILILLSLLVWPPWPFLSAYPRWPGYLLLLAAVAVLGWQVFGPAVH